MYRRCSGLIHSINSEVLKLEKGVFYNCYQTVLLFLTSQELSGLQSWSILTRTSCFSQPCYQQVALLGHRSYSCHWHCLTFVGNFSGKEVSWVRRMPEDFILEKRNIKSWNRAFSFSRAAHSVTAVNNSFKTIHSTHTNLISVCSVVF